MSNRSILLGKKNKYPDGIHYVGNDIIVSYGGKYVIIADRNLGATEAGTGANSYGDYFQRGNNYGFANSGTLSPSSTEPVSGAMRPYNSNVWIFDTYDRTTPQNDNLRGGSSSDGPTTIPTGQDALDRQGPCPDGYHVPSMGEWNKLLIIRAGIRGVYLYDDDGYKSFGDSMEATRFRDDLLLPLAGYRDYTSSASVFSQGDDGYYWSSSTFNIYAYRMALFIPGVLLNDFIFRTEGCSLRPFKNM